MLSVNDLIGIMRLERKLFAFVKKCMRWGDEAVHSASLAIFIRLPLPSQTMLGTDGEESLSGFNRKLVFLRNSLAGDDGLPNV